MAIKHAVVKVSGDKGYASEWNADHVVDDDSQPKNSTTLIVAASNSLDTTRADYVCDGINDEDEINQAISDLPAIGGRISFLEGTFDIGVAPINIDKNNVSLVGLGKSTRIQTTSNIPIITASNKSGLLITDMYIFGSGGGNPANTGIKFATVTDSYISGCWIENCEFSGINLVANCNGCKIIHNNLDSNAFSGIDITSSSNLEIIDNTIENNDDYGLLLFSCDDCIVTNNRINNSEMDGIYLANGDDNIISSNKCAGNDRLNQQLYSGITLASSDNNIVANNRCKENDNFEIDISEAGCDKNMVHGNHCLGVDHVGAINDAGTNTVLADNIVA